jgi:amino acid adenylation domain-containing protein/FkbH-like protein
MTSSIQKAPGTGILATQAVVAQVWSDVLQIGEIDAAKNFFDLGGDSLKAIEVISRLQALLNVELPLIAFFEDPTIAHLAAVADELCAQKPASDSGGSPAAVSATEAAVAQVWNDVLQTGEIEATQNFFDVGGDSLKAIEVISRLQALLHVELPLIAFFEDPTIAHLAAVADEMRSQSLKPSADAASAQLSPNRAGTAPLSSAQLMYWLLQQIDPLGHLYHQTRVVRVRGAFRADILQRAVDEICRRHEVLRARVEPGADEPVQVIDPHGRVEVRIEDLSAVAADGREGAALAIALRESQLPFNLSTDLPMRALLLRLGDDDHVLVIVMHHVVADGQTGTIFFDELSEVYGALLAGKQSGLPQLPFQYPEYAAAQRQQMQGVRLDKEVEYWRSHLEGAPPSLNLPTDKPRPGRPGHEGQQCGVLVPLATVERLKALSQATGSTLFSVMLGALRILLYRWTSQPDMVIGTVASNRRQAGSDRVIGVFLNFLPLRNSVSAHEPAADVLGREKQIVRDAFAHQDCPFVKIAASAGGARITEESPLYNVALLLQNYAETKFTGDAFSAEFVDLNSETALLDLRFLAVERSGGLQLDCEFKTELFDRASVQLLLEGFVGVLETLADGPARLVSDFAIPQAMVEQAEAARRRQQKQSVAIASTFTAEPLQSPLAFWMKELGIPTEFEFAPYNQVFQQLLDPVSLVRRNRDGVNIVLLRLADWQRFEENASADVAREKIERNVRELAGTLQGMASGLSAPMLVCLCPAERKFAADSEWSEFLIRMEHTLASDLDTIAGVHVITPAQIAAFYPVKEYEDDYADRLGHIPYTSEFFTALGSMLARRIFSLRSAPRKVIVLDCDNTLWKGVCGEEGPTGVLVDAPRRALQEFMLQQIEAGMLICLCSKNAEEDVQAVFAQNTGMALREKDIAARRVNWNPKSQNLRELAAELQLGLDSFVLVDDNPIECAEVEAQCPEVLTLLLPQNAEEIPGFLRSVWAFDHWKITSEDARRTEMYRQNAEREQIRKQASTLDDFLAGLELKLDIHPMQESDLARVSQLTERTNQFNFTTIRRTEAEVHQFLDSGGQCLVVNLSDRFGDYGLVGVILYSLEEAALAIDTLLLSCRALGRRVENNMLSRLGEIAEEQGLPRVVAEFVATKKNQPALDFLNSLGAQFQRGGGGRSQVGHSAYDFPANYAADAHRQQLSASKPDSIEERGTAKGQRTWGADSHIGDQNKLLARIATQFGDVSSISRAMEMDRVRYHPQRGIFVSPRTAIEEMVAGVWSQLLNRDRIGIHDNFFALGGHSLLATQSVARVRQTLGVELPLRAMFEAPTVAQFALRIENARSFGTELQAPPIIRVARSGNPPLSFAQQRLWFLDQLEPGNALYNIPQMVRMRGKLDVHSLHRSLNKIVERHESLRTTFGLRNGEPVQVISPGLNLPLPTVELFDSEIAASEARIQRLATEEARRPFDLAAGPLVRAQLLRLGAEDHVLLLTMHHIISDRWSMGVMSEELAAHYRAFVGGKHSPLPELAVQYADFAAWQRQWLQGAVLGAHIQYWKEHLAGAPPVLELPTDHARPPEMSLRGATQSLILPRALVEKLTALSQTEGVTLFMTLLAAFQTLLARYSGQEDIVVGSPIANRNFAEIEPLIGFFVNTLALRGDLSGDPSFHELVARLKEVCLQAYAHQDTPFEKLVEELQPERSLSHSPIFQVMFALQNAPMQALQLPGLKLDRSPVYTGTSMFDMSWFAVEVPEGLMVRAEYSTDLFEHATITRALGHFRELLEAAAAGPNQRISRLAMLGKVERHQVLAEFNSTEADFPRLCIHNLLERSAERVPDATALICGNERTSYRELNERANQIAHYLMGLGAGPEVLVGVHMERTPDLVPAIFGVLKSGAAYVPLDPSYPRERLAAILEDSGASIVLTQQSLAGQLESQSATFVCADSDWSTIAKESRANPATQVRPDNLAYVLFTSGSTGRPKGVALEHHNNVTFVQWAQTVFTPAELAGVLFCTSIGFDMSTFEIFITAAAGGKIILAENPLYLPTLPAKDEVTLINTVPSAIAELVRVNALPESLKTVALAGEALPDSLVEEIYRTGIVARVYNLYGPTESGYSTWTLVPRGGRVTIGKPIANEQCYIVDRHLNPLPIGVPGELYLAGEGLARGYFGQPDLTAERFVPNPFSAKNNARMYKTGDLCRWLPDGNIEYLGRLDHQVKLRGFRIELDEIEAVLATHPGVRQCLVMAREDEPGLKRLVAYVVPRETQPAAEDGLVDHLKRSLPDFMVPSVVVVLEQFPLTPNGKIDRKSLPMPEYKKDSGESYIAPRTSTEERVASIWAEVLHLEQVSAESDFFALGGHSLLAAQVISRLRQAFEIEIPLKAMFESPKLDILAARIQVSKRGFETPPIQRIPRDKPLPASFAQQRLWFLDQLEPDSPAYNIAYTLKIMGPINADAIEKSLNLIAQRHESLRTSFGTEAELPVQIIHDSVRIPFRKIDLSALDAGVRETEARRLIAEDANRAIGLTQAPLLRTMLLHLSQDEHYLLINVHHVISDRWSMSVLTRELATLYESVIGGRTADLPDLPLQYADYAVWQREWLRGEVMEKQLAYWKDKLTDAPSVLALPTDRPRQATESFRGDVAHVSLSRELSDKLNHLSRKHGATLFMTLLAGFQALLSRYSGQDDVVVGTAIANRNQPELENLIGFFLNTLPLRTKLAGDPSFAEIISRTKETALGAYAHQDMPFERLVEELRPERSLSHSPLVQVFFVLQNAPVEELQLRGLRLKHVPSGLKTVKGDMYLSMHETPEGLEGRLEYSTDLFDASTVEKLLGHFRVLLEAAVANPEMKLSELPLLTEGERQQILVEWNATESDFPRHFCMHQLFEEQVARTPNRVAAFLGTQEITYNELNSRSNQLAHHLRKLGVGPGTLVGIYIERNLDMLVALLGILKAGGAYVPIDPAYPKERIAFILEDANAPVLLTQQSLMASAPKSTVKLMCLDSDWPPISRESSDNPTPMASPKDLAYVLYTSGSTGKPKGVQIEHRNLVNFLISVQKEPELKRGDRLLAVTTLSFDIAGLEIYLPLITGAEIVLASREEAADGQRLLALMTQAKPSVMQATPATWRMLIEAGWKGSPELKVLCGGEALPADLAEQLLPRCRELWNMYGPTETTIWSSVYRVPAGLTTTAPIGRPMANTTMYVLDSQLQPVPAGVAGELYIGGDGLARGYFNRPELTAEKFIRDPFGSKPSARLYRTGDLAKHLPAGNIQYLGRTDFQVKLRGFRIELGEIESALAQHPAVRQTVVVAREDKPGDKRLVAYVVLHFGQQLSATEARAHVKQSLPEYMAPSALVELDSLPLTPNGKVDRKRLPAPDYGASETGKDRSTRTPTEEIIAGIWAEVLNLEQVGAEDDFFELGGHSLLATQAIARIRQAFKLQLPLRSMFESSTVAGLAERVDAMAKQEHGLLLPPIKQVPRSGALPTSFPQQRLWFLDQLEPGSPLYNVGHVTRMHGPLNPTALEKSLNEIVRRHESLRTTFHTVNDQPVQVIAPELEIKIEKMDVSHLPTLEAREAEARKLATGALQRPFNLAVGPLVRPLLIKIGEQDHGFILNTHHIISDRWSLGVLSQELAALYEANLQGKPSPLSELEIQFADYAVWQREYLSGEALEKQLTYWRQQLEGAPPVLELPTDRPRKGTEQFWGAQHRQPIPRELANAVKAVSRAQRGTFFMALLAGFELLMGRLAGQDDVVIGTDLANRSPVETEKLIGFFVNLLPMRARVNREASFTEFFQQVRETSLEAMAHQDIPFDKLVEELRPERSLTHNPLVQVLFVMQNTPQMVREFGGLKLVPLGVSSSSRFDLVLFINDPESDPWTMWVYNPNLFDAGTIERMANHYELLLKKVCEDPGVKLGALSAGLDEAEKNQRENKQKKFQETGLEKLKKIRRKVIAEG